jgi:putative acetyltransferase
MIIFNRTSYEDKDFQSLVTLLDKDLAIRDGDEHAFYAQFNTIQKLRHTIVCYVDNKHVACGAFKEFDPARVEIKRMYVLPEYRSQGLGLAVLKELEKWASELNYTGCVLETGKKQPEAIRLYEKAGYTRIESYGQYLNVENSVCMARSIS